MNVFSQFLAFLTNNVFFCFALLCTR
jgi:hypothetical protein